jgi:hypothetical protein
MSRFARNREIAINPLAALPHKTTFHEMAHVVLGHTTSETLVDGELTPHHLREVEAESVALICCETLGLSGAEFCRGYIQHWLKTEKEIPNHNAARIFTAATSILKAELLRRAPSRTPELQRFGTKAIHRRMAFFFLPSQKLSTHMELVCQRMMPSASRSPGSTASLEEIFYLAPPTGSNA